MADNAFLRDLTAFFKAARHLWGRCPKCGDLFRLSDAAISFGNEPPRDWLRKLERTKAETDTARMDVRDWQTQVQQHEMDVSRRERDVMARERDLEAIAQARARALLKDKDAMRGLLKQARQEGAQRSRSALLGALIERLAPFLQRFGHDPRDLRPLFNPLDYVVFDGLTERRRVDRITFVEVKTGTSTTSSTQRSIVAAVADGRVATEIWQFGKRGIALEQQLLRAPLARKALPPG